MNNLYYSFECGCKIEQFGNEIKPEDGLPPLKIDYYNINHNCPKTWALFDEGKTKGVFQLDKGLGPHWSKVIKPDCIEEIAAISALLRPGCLKSMIDGKSVTQHYADRKNGLEPITYIHNSIKDILEPTQGVLTFQEQSLKIAQVVAGFSLQQADTLRKAIGKKEADTMAKVRMEFIEGCKKTNIVNDETAISIFDNIEKSNRYSFNKCLSPTTIVETTDGLKTLEEIQIVDKVLAPSDDLSQDIFVDVVAIHDNGEQEVFEVIMESGKTIVCTADHKFLCDNELELPLWQIIHENRKIMCLEE